MNRILAAFDGLKFSAGTRDYAISLALQTHAYIVGVFLEDPTSHSYRIYDLVTDEENPDAKRQMLDEQDRQKRDAAVASLLTSCEEAGIPHTIHRDRDVAIQDLLRESIYADLLVIGRNEMMSAYTDEIPSDFIRDLLPDVQCPVLLTPPEYQPIDRIVLLYDGAPSSVYAIKMLRYTLPVGIKYPVEVITVDGGEEDKLPGEQLVKEFMNCHFPAAGYTLLKGDAEDEIVRYLGQGTGHPLVVSGAYRRGRVSRWFRPSMADVLMKNLNLPLFVAHNR